MTIEENERTLARAIEAMRRDIKQDIQEYIDGAIEAHRRRMWVRDKWCCLSMGEFAKVVWLAPNPPRRDETVLGSTSLKLRGFNVNYCPFCGVRV